MGDDVTPAVRRRRSRMARIANDVALCSQMYLRMLGRGWK